MSEEILMPQGGSSTKDDPLLVAHWAYRTCHHDKLKPQPTKGQRYRVTAYLDLDGRCPACTEARAKQKAAAKAPASKQPQVTKMTLAEYWKRREAGCDPRF